MEKLLRRMISPNADLRCTASEAMADPYWTQTQTDVPVPSHSEQYAPITIVPYLDYVFAEKPASVSNIRPASVVDATKLSEGLPRLKSRVSKDISLTPKSKAEKKKVHVSGDKENVSGPPGLIREKSRSASVLGTLPHQKRPLSQSVTQTPEGAWKPCRNK